MQTLLYTQSHYSHFTGKKGVTDTYRGRSCMKTGVELEGCASSGLRPPPGAKSQKASSVRGQTPPAQTAGLQTGEGQLHSELVALSCSSPRGRHHHEVREGPPCLGGDLGPLPPPRTCCLSLGLSLTGPAPPPSQGDCSGAMAQACVVRYQRLHRPQVRHLLRLTGEETQAP